MNWIGEAAEQDEKEESANLVEVLEDRPWIVGLVEEVPEPPKPLAGLQRARREKGREKGRDKT